MCQQGVACVSGRRIQTLSTSCLELTDSREDQASALQCWSAYSASLPLLSSLARRILSTSGTSVPSETASSASSFIVRKESGRLTPENLASAMFLRDKPLTDWSLNFQNLFRFNIRVKYLNFSVHRYDYWVQHSVHFESPILNPFRINESESDRTLSDSGSNPRFRLGFGISLITECTPSHGQPWLATEIIIDRNCLSDHFIKPITESDTSLPITFRQFFVRAASVKLSS